MSEPTVEHSLDELAKGLATGTLSRGKALRWMGGALLGAALASFPGAAWANDCRRLGRACRRDSQCCSKNCIRREDDKVCACPQGQDRCNDRCVNLDRNENHCGECFNRCDDGVQCVDGECGGGCVPDGGDCSSDTDCCGGCCGGFCNSNICGSCRPIGGDCTTDTQCCFDSFNCSNNKCAPCVQLGGSCTADIQCCLLDGGVRPVCDNNTCATCIGVGGQCPGAAPCCDPAICLNNVCT
jgi:hypothetical protein